MFHVDVCVFMFVLSFPLDGTCCSFFSAFHVFFHYRIYKIGKFFKSFGFFPNHLFIFNFDGINLVDTSIKQKSMSREHRFINFYWNNWIRNWDDADHANNTETKFDLWFVFLSTCFSQTESYDEFNRLRI